MAVSVFAYDRGLPYYSVEGIKGTDTELSSRLLEIIAWPLVLLEMRNEFGVCPLNSEFYVLPFQGDVAGIQRSNRMRHSTGRKKECGILQNRK